MSESLEYIGLVLEDQLLDHLATPEGAMAIWKERLDPDCIPDKDEGIREALKFVYLYMDDHRVPPTPAIIAEETGYEDFNVPETPVEYVIAKFRERHQKQGLKRVLTKVGRTLSTPEEALSYGISALTELSLQTAERGTMRTSEDLALVIDDYNERRKKTDQTVPFGYGLMDDHLQGLRLGEIAVILARPKRYKSWQLVKSAVEAVKSGHNAFFETMEMSEAEMQARFHCMVAQISWHKYQHGLLGPDEMRILKETADELFEWPYKCIFHRAKPDDRTVPHIVANAIDREADVLYIDQLSFFKGAKDEGNWRIIGQIMDQLKDATQHFPIYMAAQYGRNAVQEERIADVSNAALSGFIEQYADHLFGIYASRDMLENKILHLGLTESRTFEPVTWEVKVELTQRSDFKMLNVLDA